MTTEMTMPQLGESVTEGTISRWLVEPGQTVNKYEPIAEVLTDKVSAEIPSSYTGTIKELLVSEDETVEVGRAICMIDVTNSVTVEEQTNDIPVSEQNSEHNHEEIQSQKRRYSPAVLRLASEHNIDLESVTGTGKGGRITRKDIQAVVDSGGVRTQAPAAEPQREELKQRSVVTPKHVTSSGDIEIPLSNTRKAIAANMVNSKKEAPHAWMMVEADVTNLVQYRNAIKNEFKQKEGFNITFLPFFIKAVVEALKEFPEVNAVWGGDKIIQKKEMNISVAVATDDALFVPVIKNADEKSIKAIGREVNELASKARTGKLSADDMQGGTFTVNNTAHLVQFFLRQF